MSTQMLAHRTHATTAGWSWQARPVKPRSRRRATRLLTLRREVTPRVPRAAATTAATAAATATATAIATAAATAAARDDRRGLGLRHWLSTLLSQRQTLELDITVLILILRALGKQPDRRQRMLTDTEFRKRVFNEFLVVILKAYESSENIDDDSPNDASNKNLRGREEKSDQRRVAGSGSREPSSKLPGLSAASPELPDLPMLDPSDDDELPAASTPASRAATATTKQKTLPTPGRPRCTKEQLKNNKFRKLEGPPAAPNSTMAAVVLSGDLCYGVTNMLRTAGRRMPKDDIACRKLALKDEDDSAVPVTSFLFIRCVRCPELVFTDYRAIREHWEARRHFLSCIMCDNIVSSSRLALAHLRLVHEEPVPAGWFRLVRCHPCRRSGFYSTEQVISHMAGHRAERARNPAVFPPFLTCYKTIRCNQCGLLMVNQRDELTDHYRRDPPPPCQHDPLRPPAMPCPICGRVWAGAAALAAHLRLRRGYCKGSYIPRTTERSLCPVCRRRLLPGEAFIDHLMTHQAPGLRCVDCGHVAASHQEMQAHWAFTWRCDCAACDTHVGRGARLLQHVVEDHDGGKLLTETARARPRRNEDRGVCPICGKYQFKVNDHIAMSHTTRYCPCCDKVVAKCTWLKHRRCQKNPDRTRCKVCQKVLSTRYAMKGHMRLHTGERPFECELCDADFQQRYQLKTHMKSAHGIVWPPAGAAGGVTT